MEKLTAAKQQKLFKHTARKLRQEMHKPMVIKNKKKELARTACRKEK